MVSTTLNICQNVSLGVSGNKNQGYRDTGQVTGQVITVCQQYMSLPVDQIWKLIIEHLGVRNFYLNNFENYARKLA